MNCLYEFPSLCKFGKLKRFRIVFYTQNEPGHIQILKYAYHHWFTFSLCVFRSGRKCVRIRTCPEGRSNLFRIYFKKKCIGLVSAQWHPNRFDGRQNAMYQIMFSISNWFSPLIIPLLTHLFVIIWDGNHRTLPKSWFQVNKTKKFDQKYTFICLGAIMKVLYSIYVL